MFTGSYTELTNKPTIPTDISQLTDTTNKIGSGGGTTFVQGTGGGLIIAGDDSTQVTILPSNTLQIAGEYQYQPPFPFIPGSEAGGIIKELSPNAVSYTHLTLPTILLV